MLAMLGNKSAPQRIRVADIGSLIGGRSSDCTLSALEQLK